MGRAVSGRDGFRVHLFGIRLKNVKEKFGSEIEIQTAMISGLMRCKR